MTGISPRSGASEHFCRLPALSTLAAATLVHAALSVPATAQEAPNAASQSSGELCQVFAVSAPEGGLQELHANCRGRGVMLGLVSEFEAIHNEALQATLVVARLGDERRVLLLTTQDNGLPLVEDLAGQIALAAGRGSMSPLDGIELDLKAYARTGEVGVRPAPHDRANARSDRISVSEQVIRERGRRAEAAAKN